MIEDLIVKLRDEVAVVIVTHNLQQAYRVADYVGFMYLGELVEYGNLPQAIFGHPGSNEQRSTSVVRSVRRMSAACIATLPVALVLTGCVSTQRIAARARLVSARELTSQSTTEVTQANPEVTIGRLTLIRTHTGTAIVASLRNNASSTLTDLPISVGVHTHGSHPVYLNRSANLDYFDSHVAAIAPHARHDVGLHDPWTRARPAEPFATVGISALHPAAGAHLPQIDVSTRAGRSGSGERCRVGVEPFRRSLSTTSRYTRSRFAPAVMWAPDARA